MDLQTGDIFLTYQGGFIPRCIRAVIKFWSVDNDADYIHAGIITSSNGSTFEARTKTGCYHISDFTGIPVLIGRHKLMTKERFDRGMKSVARYEGAFYPWWRIALYLFRPLAKTGTGDFLVCSELVSKFLCGCGLLDNYKGWTPDNLADMVTHWKLWDIIHEGENNV